MSPGICRHADVWVTDDFRSCMSCGETLPASEHLYTKLDTTNPRAICLIELQPGAGTTPIRCRVVTHTLTDHLVYEAVSYTWATEDGDDTPSQAVTILGGGVMYVTRNCESALQRLRRRTHVRILWIDSICIDQANINERNHQVSLMDLIYRSALRVHICISHRKNSYTEFMRWLEKWQQSPTLQIRDQEAVMLKAQLKDLFVRRYFHRVWVIQETALAKSVILHVNDEEVYLSHATIGRLGSLCTFWNIEIPGPLKWVSARQFNIGIVPWLKISVVSGCKDPRDKIFAILSLVDPHSRDLIPVDYSLSLEQVIAKAIIACVNATQSIAIINYARLRLGSDEASESNFDLEAFGRYIQERTIRVVHSLPEGQGWGQASNTLWSSGHDGAQSNKASSLETIPNSARTWSVLPVTGEASTLTFGLLPRFRVQAYLLDESLGCETSAPFSIGEGDFGLRCCHSWVGGKFHRVDPLSSEFQRTAEMNDLDVPMEPHISEINQDVLAMLYNLPDILAFGAVLREIGRDYTYIYLFETHYSVGATHYPHQRGDLVFRIQGLDVPLLLREVKSSVYRIVQPCYLWAAGQLDYWNPGTRKGVWYKRHVDLGTAGVRTIEIY